MITIYHNPRCSKSRECNIFLDNSENDVQIINYMKTPFTFDTLKSLIDLLKINPIELVRKNEQIWKDQFKGKELNDKEIITAMVENPKLIQRPIVVNGNKAVIARPLEKMDEIL
ncbi:MAG: arsenate reductase [Flavobacteriaceae bacterium]|jgi:arsenate reductase